MKSSQNLKNSLEVFSSLMSSLYSKANTFLDLNPPQIEERSEFLKNYLISKIDKCTQIQKERLEVYQNGFKRLKNDLEVLKVVTKKVMKKGVFTSQPNQLRKKVYVSISANGENGSESESESLGKFLFEDPAIPKDQILDEYKLLKPMKKADFYSDLIWEELVKAVKDLPKKYSPVVPAIPVKKLQIDVEKFLPGKE